MSFKAVCTVAREPRHFPEGKYPENIKVVFRTPAGRQVNVNCKQIPSPKASFLMSLLPGEEVPLEAHRNDLYKPGGKIPRHYYEIDTFQVIQNLRDKYEG